MSNNFKRPYFGHFADASAPVVLSPACELTIQDLVAVSRGDGKGNYARVVLGGDWRNRCERSADYIRRAVEATMGKTQDELAGLARSRSSTLAGDDSKALATRALIYGVTTGFGSFKSRPLDTLASALQMQHNILRSHATGMGPPFATEVVRAMMLLRLRTFVEGYSGVRPKVLELLVEFLNRRIHPWVPEQGSVGSSGDLCPLAHLALVLTGEGLAWLDAGTDSPGYAWSTGGTDATELSGQWDVRLDRRPPPRPAKDVLLEAGLSEAVLTDLQPKEGLALTNGTAATTALAALAVYDAGLAYGAANLAASLSLQALQGSTRAFDPKVHALRRHSGQTEAARQILAFASGSSLVNRAGEVQDAYSLRCAPAVHGAALTALEHAWSVVEQELNGVTDNPLFILSETHGPPCDEYATCIWDAYSAGNFHGEPIGLAVDYLKIAVAELANISERRVQCLLDEHHNRGLPANLWPDAASAGLNTGLMIVQYAAAALVSENKVLAHPASVDSIPTSANVEDHVAMAPIAARHARRINENSRNVLAVEFLASLQALDLRLSEPGSDAKTALSPAARAAHHAIRSGGSTYPPVTALSSADDILWPSVAAIHSQIGTGSLLRSAINAIPSQK